MDEFKICILLSLFFILIGCQESPEDARLKLGQMNIPYTNEAYREHINKGDKVVVELFLKAGMDPNQGLVTAASGDHPDLFNLLLDKGADLKKETASQALVAAAQRGNYEIGKTLLQNGVDVNSNESVKKILLVSARRKDSNEFMKLLIEKGIDVNLRDNNNANALIISAKDSSKFEIIQLLLTHGVDVNLVDNSGATALFNSIKSGNAHTVKTLLENQADINQRDKSGNSTLMTSVDEGNYKIVELLVNSGVDVNTRNHIGQMPLKKAESKGFDDIAKLLMEKGAVSGYKIIPVTNGGTIAGRVTYAGAVPLKTKIEIDKDVEVCGKTERFKEDLVVSDNKGLANVVVSITNIYKGKSKETLGNEFYLDQNGCIFVPHVLIIPAGAECTILNTDRILYSIHTYSEINNSVNLAQPGFKKRIALSFHFVETFPIRSDLHNWMEAYIVVVEHPYYAKTNRNGKFEIKDIPPGTYTVEYWHERLEKQSKEITIAPGSSIDASCEFKASP